MYGRGSQASNIAGSQAQFWTGASLTWQILARVNGHSYALFGAPQLPTNVSTASTVSANYSSTHTYFTVSAANYSFVLDFFSPVTPTDNVQQSMPFSFFTVEAVGNAGADVQVFVAIDDTWIASSSASYQLQYTSTSNHSYFSFQNTSATAFTEKNNMAPWSSIQLGVIGNSSQVTAGTGIPAQMQQNFTSRGVLSPGTTGGSLKSGNMVALTYDLGRVSGTASVTFSVGNYRNQSVLYTGQSVNEVLVDYFFTSFPTLDTAFSFFLGTYATTYKASLVLDRNIRSAAMSISSAYADMVEATVRQVFGAVELLVNSANPDLQNPLAILKEISSDGDANTCDVIYPTLPIYLYLNPEWIRYHLQPYVNYLQAGRWPHNFIPHDNGAFPKATSPGTENMPLQTTSSYLHMLYAYNNATNGTNLAWIQAQETFLAPMAANLLTIANATTDQLATVDWAGSHPNQTGLAIQGAQALVVYGRLFNNASYVTAGQNLAHQLYHRGLGLDVNRTHFTYVYGDDVSWNVQGPGFFMDNYFELNLFPSAAWTNEAAWYAKQNTAIGLPYIGGFNTTGDGCTPHGGNLVITEWTFWAAAGMSNQSVAGQLVQSAYAFFTDGLNGVPWPTRYCTVGSNKGQWQLNRARPTVGSIFAPLLAALK